MEMVKNNLFEQMQSMLSPKEEGALLKISEPVLQNVLQLVQDFNKIKDNAEEKIKDFLISEFYNRTGIKAGDFLKCGDTICYVDGFKVDTYLYLTLDEQGFDKNSIFFRMLIRPMLPGGKFSLTLGSLYPSNAYGTNNGYIKITDSEEILKLQNILKKSGKSKHHERAYVRMGGTTYFM